jgi:hypothetical protein
MGRCNSGNTGITFSTAFEPGLQVAGRFDRWFRGACLHIFSMIAVIEARDIADLAACRCVLYHAMSWGS